VADIIGFVFDNMLLIVTGAFGVVGLMILALIWLGILPGRDLMPLPKVLDSFPADAEFQAPPKA